MSGFRLLIQIHRLDTNESKSAKLENIFFNDQLFTGLFMDQQHELIESFLDYLYLERGLAYNTIASYRYDLDKFHNFVIKQKRITFKKVNREILTEYYQYLINKKLEISSIFRNLVALKMFFRYLLVEEIIGKDLSHFIEFPRMGKKLPEALSIEDVNKLLAEENFKGKLGKRDKAILELLYATGMRVSELINLKRNDLNLEHRLLKCTGKGNKERWIPITDKAHAALFDYIAYNRPKILKKADLEILFLNSRGGPITRQGVFLLIKNYSKMSGIKINVTPHTLRHTLATHLIENGADLRSVQEILGHADISTTQIYTHVSRKWVKDEYFKAFPRAYEE